MIMPQTYVAPLKLNSINQFKSLLQYFCQERVFLKASFSTQCTIRNLSTNGRGRSIVLKHCCKSQYLYQVKGKQSVLLFQNHGLHTKSNDALELETPKVKDESTKHKKGSHIPVMVAEVLDSLQPKQGQLIVDMTFGGGGHAKEILKISPDIHYVASDRDPFAYNKAKEWAATSGNGKIWTILSRFSETPTHFQKMGIQPGQVDAFLFDLGTSSFQFDFPHRGFSLSRNGPLDMRMDGNRFPDEVTAADVVNTLDVADIEHILRKYGEEKKYKEIAHAIVEARYAFGKFTHTQQLADVVNSVFNSDIFRQDKLSRPAHLATKTFQALRIFVNDELNELNSGLHIARHYLKTDGRCVVISFHSLEDRIVKRHFHDIDMDQECNISLHQHFRNSNLTFDLNTLRNDYLSKMWKPLCRKIQEPTAAEIESNARARSAKLRAAIKV